MMKLTNQLANRLREVVLNGKWVAYTNFRDQLSQTTLEQATRQIGDLNTIAALTFHINYYLAGVVEFFEKGSLDIRDKYSFDMPEVASEADWDRLRQELYDNAERFAQHIEQMPEEKLWETFVDERYGPYYRNMEGMIEHCYYHLGQVSLIRKLVTSEE